ncbi:SOS response-associated peptidase [Rothia sp. ZJ932]|uniref:SOS response-associated peptidase n=1 Tax=Rothia sp. ZJ932 TaxID=2810516 RepID=UPI00196816E1|nr:SOS response-associated peptidase [Rothia sp. ZJ932]QRZ62436.1 SOS response-associated peptidase [Rothia sp. ZJ932]
MCGRYALNFDHGVYLAGVPLEHEIRNFNVAPTHTVPVIVERLAPPELFADDSAQVGERVRLDDSAQETVREIHFARWGLLPSWAKDASFAARAFNARSETVLSKPTFRAAAVRGHCAIPVSGYFEWKTETTTAGKTQKTPYFIHRADREPIYFAGLYEWWKITDAEAQRPNSRFAGQAGQWLLSCSMITIPSPDELDATEAADNDTEALALMDLGNLHDRLPVPLSEKSLGVWLRSGKVLGLEGETALEGVTVQSSAVDALAQVLQDAYRQARNWRMHPVSMEVGNVANNAPHLIEPVEDLLSGL